MWDSIKKIGSGTGSWLQEKVSDPLLLVLQRGAEPSQLAFSAALGITFGVFPICGVTVFLCGLAIAVLGPRCNAPTAMVANFVATPLEFSLMIPFLRLGEFVSGGDHFPLSSDALKKVLKGQASHEILQSIYHAIIIRRQSTHGVGSDYHHFGWLLFLALRPHAFSRFKDLVTCTNGLVSILAVLIIHVSAHFRKFTMDDSSRFS